MDWNSFVANIPLYIAATSALITGAVFSYKRVIKPVLESIRSYKDINSKIDIIISEITPNGGSSIKDSINRIERETALTRERHRAVIADTQEAMFETDVEGNCVWVNRTYAKLVERTPGELLGHGWVNAISEEDREDVMSSWYKAVEENREFSKTYNFSTPDGTLIKAKCLSYKMTHCDGHIIGYFGIVKRIE